MALQHLLYFDGNHSQQTRILLRQGHHDVMTIPMPLSGIDSFLTVFTVA